MPEAALDEAENREADAVRRFDGKKRLPFFLCWLSGDVGSGFKIAINGERGKQTIMSEDEKSEQKGDLYFEGGTIIACTKYTAAYFGVTPATLSNWMKAGCPRVKHGYYDIKAVSEWNAQREGEKLAEVAKKDPEKMTPSQMKMHYDALLKQAQLDSTLLKNQIASGEYLPKTEIVDSLSKFFSVFRASAMGLGHELGLTVASYIDADGARKADKLISDRVEDALAQMSVDGVYRPGTDAEATKH